MQVKSCAIQKVSFTWCTFFLLSMFASTALAGIKISAKAYVLIDDYSRHIIAEHHSQQPLPPASLTKMMTVYLAFQALEQGRIKLQQRVRVSKKAARQPPTRLGLSVVYRPTIRRLILGCLVPSGNDAAVALAEAVGGSGSHFVRMMNDQARRLGMKQTHFKNPSGLPARGHVSTAYDMALLSRAIIHTFPQYYPLFSKQHFIYAGRRLHNHNHLLGTVKGVDGLKTGFTRAAGSCLAVSAQKEGRRIIAVILGAPNWRIRDLEIKKLIKFGFQKLRYCAANNRESLPWSFCNRFNVNFDYGGYRESILQTASLTNDLWAHPLP